MTIAMAAILRRWRLCAADGHAVREIAAAVPRPDALPMIVEPR